jgi:hypothetical protein
MRSPKEREEKLNRKRSRKKPQKLLRKWTLLLLLNINSQAWLLPTSS